ncbi:hypothetical protein ACQEVF_37190 [Nonomuraea polychroma]|uniref:hypothetical protein n=1 Tax=Nonomuraea polychroma TaxID=46176 RepID=UPI003D91B468
MSVRAEKNVENEISSEFRRVQDKHGIVALLAQAAPDLPEEPVRGRWRGTASACRSRG